MTVASRIAVMDQGRIVQVATPAEIYETPNSVYVADFIGDVNVIEGTAGKSDTKQTAIHWAEGENPIIGMATEILPESTRCHFAIRPEKVSISAEKPDDRPNSFQGQVLDIAYLGNISTYHVKLRNGQVIKAQTANSRRIKRRSFNWEDTVWLSWTDTAGVILKE